MDTQLAKCASTISKAPTATITDNGITLCERIGVLNVLAPTDGLEMSFRMSFLIDEGYLIIESWNLYDESGEEIFFDELSFEDQEDVLADLDNEKKRHQKEFKNQLKAYRSKKAS